MTGTGATDVPALAVDPADLRPGPDQPRRAWVEHVMGMPVSFRVRGPLARVGAGGPTAPGEPTESGGPSGSGESGGAVEAAVRRAIADLHRTDAIFSTYRADSEISRLRRGELTVADCDPWVREVVALCAEARERTDGAFDADLPDADGVRRFDPTGLVKGWAIERVTRELSDALPDHDVLVNAGGDIAVRCRRTDTPDWTLAIEDPADRTRLLATVPLRSGGMATSGTAARGDHILDTASGRPVSRGGSVTVVGPDLMWADVHATAAFARADDAEAYLARLTGHLSFLVRPDGTTATVPPPP